MTKKLLPTLYTRSVNGLPLLGRPAALAEQFEADRQEETTRSIIRLYTVLCGGTGFVCGLPGYLSMPLTVPANIGGVLLLQLHMSAALATVYGYDAADDEIRETCIRCVLEHSESVSKEGDAWQFYKRFGVKVAERGLRYLSEQALRFASDARRTRSLPFVGGVTGGISDGYATRKVGRAAQRAFRSSERA